MKTWYEEDKNNPIQEIITWRGRAVSSIKKAFNTAKKKAGITRRLRPYDFRHAFATAMLTKGGDLKATSEILGHSRPDTTNRIYHHTNMDLYRENMNKIPSLDD